MDDLEVNPLYKAFLNKFKREFEMACKMSYLVAIPHSSELEHSVINQHFANSHILAPSKLLKMHFNQLQAGNFADIEMDDKKLICHPDAKRAGDCPSAVVVKILAEEIGYNAASREYRTILISRPLVMTDSSNGLGDAHPRAPVTFRTILAPLSPRSQILAQMAKRQRAQLISSRQLAHHDECAKYLECISQELTVALENDVKRMQSNYIILAQYLEDAARRARAIVEKYIGKYELTLEQSHQSFEWLCETIQRSIRISVENYVIYLLHGKLLAAIHKFYEREDSHLQQKFELVADSNLSICQLGAQLDFSDFAMSDELTRTLKRLPNLQSPIAMVGCLMKLLELISEALNQSVKLKRLLGDGANQSGAGGQMLHSSAWQPTPICSDDLIASLVFCLPRARPNNLYSAIRYLELFGWSSVDRDQVSYYLATFESAVEYILAFSDQRDESRPRERRPERAGVRHFIELERDHNDRTSEGVLDLTVAPI